MKNRKKTVLICVIVAAVVLASAGGLWYLLRHRTGEPVKVFSFQHLGSMEFWGDTQDSYGPVSTDKIQTVFLTETQTVTEIAVEPGQTVKKGDLLLTFDTTLTDIALERERLKVEKLKLDLQDARDRLQELRNMRPMVIPSQPETPEEENQGVAITGAYQVSQKTAYDGSAKATALVCWLADTTDIDDTLLAALHQISLDYRAANIPVPADPADPTDPTQETLPPADPDVFFVVFKVTEKNMSLGLNLLWQGMKVTKDNSSYSFRFYDASQFADHSLAVPESPVQPDIDFGSGFTASQLAQMRAEQEKAIRDLEFQVKMAEADYKIKQTEMTDGKVYSQIDGTVVSLLTPEEAILTQQPFMKVSGGGGFYVEGSVSELVKDDLQIGQEVTVNDWNTGMTYAGVVRSVGDIPTQNEAYNGMGNPNVSYYPFQVFVGEEADLQAGSYVSIQYTAAQASTGIYLQNPFLRTENGQTYAYVRGADGKLEKRTVVTGRSLWGSYTEIVSGLTAEDFIAFPYGKHIKEGAPTVEAELHELYE